MERIAAPEGSRRTIRLDAPIIERESCGSPK
jgi:LacI family transcriptional regulator